MARLSVKAMCGKSPVGTVHLRPSAACRSKSSTCEVAHDLRQQTTRLPTFCCPLIVHPAEPLPDPMTPLLPAPRTSSTGSFGSRGMKVSLLPARSGTPARAELCHCTAERGGANASWWLLAQHAGHWNMRLARWRQHPQTLLSTGYLHITGCITHKHPQKGSTHKWAAPTSGTLARPCSLSPAAR